MKLYLDDIRQPPTGWELARDYDDFVQQIAWHGIPEEVSFDHDLADIHYDPRKAQESFSYHEKTGLDCAKFLIDRCIEYNKPLPKWSVHSMNPVGKQNITELLNNFKNKQQQ